MRLFLLLMLVSGYALADNDKVEAAIGGGVGGAVGAVVGEELGDREGAIIGAAAGAAIGAALATDDDEVTELREPIVTVVEIDHPHPRHCPPGQAKKGRC